jgi:type VI secretion system protein ImpJ
VYDGTYFAADLKPAVFEGRNLYFLALRSDEDPKKMVNSVTTTAKLSSREKLPLLIVRALPGVGLEHLPTPPQELPRRAKTVYFSIEHHAEQWNKVQKSNNVALYWDSAPKDLLIELMIVSR